MQKFSINFLIVGAENLSFYLTSKIPTAIKRITWYPLPLPFQVDTRSIQWAWSHWLQNRNLFCCPHFPSVCNVKEKKTDLNGGGQVNISARVHQVKEHVRTYALVPDFKDNPHPPFLFPFFKWNLYLGRGGPSFYFLYSQSLLVST